jgi:type II secretory pathway pseudopilin PulG
MEFKLERRTESAFKLIELIVVLVVIVVLAGLILPPLGLARYKAKRIQCVNNLKIVGLGLRIFASDHSDAYPAQLAADLGGAQQFVSPGDVFRHFLTVSNTIRTPKTLICPADSRSSVNLFNDLKDGNISYFISLDATVDQTRILLTGDRNLTLDGTPVNPGLLVLRTNSAIGFTCLLHRGSGNVVLGDGSAWYVPGKNFEQHLRQQPIETSRILIP